MIYFILTFFVGTAVGSFVNVLIDRTVEGKDWIRGRSKCDYCQKTLKWYDLIPVFSYVFYRGKSRCCQKKLSYQYPIVELIVGLMFVWWLAIGFWFFQLVNSPLLSVIQPGFWLITGILLAILVLADLFYGIVMMAVLWVGVATTLLYRILLISVGVYQTFDLWVGIMVASIFYGLFWGLYKATSGRGMADGDMYVALYMGLLLGWPRGVVALMLSFIIGAVVGIILIAAKLRSRKQTIPFVPFMVVSTAIALIWGDQIWRMMYA